MVRQRNIVVLSRYPRPGRTKTRLIPALGAVAAARVHRELAGRTVLVTRVASSLLGTGLEVHGTGGSAKAFRAWLGPLEYRPQVGGDLGDRMQAALSAHLDSRTGPAVIVGTDCPWLEPRHLEEAFSRLTDHDVVIGPALDGGYYLLGLAKPVPEIFRGIPWGTEHVLEATRASVARLGLRLSLLEPLGDVDRPEDFEAWRRASQSASGDRRVSNDATPEGSKRPEISVIVPALNEVTLVGAAVGSALRRPGVEVVVVDGGSSDGTVDAARECGGGVLTGEGSRALRQNMGALHVRGETLVFLHADACLPGAYLDQIRETLARPGVVAGAFHLRIDGRLAGLRAVERLADWRSRLFQLPYGDQALFLSRRTFFEQGGFGLLPIMEDYEFVRRLRRRGRIITCPASIRVSARRWTRLGVWRTTWVNQLMILRYRFGTPAERLARFYRSQE